MQIKSRPEFKERRRKLRTGQTEAENLLWAHVRGKKIRGLRFLRQYGVGSYIVDFYCPKMKLAVELDGGQHSDEDVARYDQDRDAFLARLGICVLRFRNREVVENMSVVLNKIRKFCSHP